MKDFIKIISDLSLEEMNDLIKEKGKAGRVIPGIIFINDDCKKLSSPQYNN